MALSFNLMREQLKNIRIIKDAETLDAELKGYPQANDFSRSSFGLTKKNKTRLRDASYTRETTEEEITDEIRQELGETKNNDKLTKLLLNCGGQSCTAFLSQIMARHFYSKSTQEGETGLMCMLNNGSNIGDEPSVLWERIEGQDKFSGNLKMKFTDTKNNEIEITGKLELSYLDGKPHYEIKSLKFKAKNPENIFFSPQPFFQNEEEMFAFSTLSHDDFKDTLPTLDQIQISVSTNSIIFDDNFGSQFEELIPTLRTKQISTLKREIEKQFKNIYAMDEDSLKKWDSKNIRDRIDSLENYTNEMNSPENKRPKKNIILERNRIEINNDNFSSTKDKVLVEFMLKLIGRSLLGKDYLGKDQKGRNDFKRIAALYNNDAAMMMKVLNLNSPESREAFKTIGRLANAPLDYSKVVASMPHPSIATKLSRKGREN